MNACTAKCKALPAIPMVLAKVYQALRVRSRVKAHSPKCCSKVCERWKLENNHFQSRLPMWEQRCKTRGILLALISRNRLFLLQLNSRKWFQKNKENRLWLWSSGLLLNYPWGQMGGKGVMTKCMALALMLFLMTYILFHSLGSPVKLSMLRMTLFV